jgi:hypothetical protein
MCVIISSIVGRLAGPAGRRAGGPAGRPGGRPTQSRVMVTVIGTRDRDRGSHGHGDRPGLTVTWMLQVFDPPRHRE